MGLFDFSQEEILTFFAVLVRYSVLFAVLPVVGDRFVPTPAKVLLSLAVTLTLFPALVSRGYVNPGEAIVWGSSAGGIVVTIALEVMVALALGFTARLLFDAIRFGANLMGTFMGFAMASAYDPHQETQSQVVAEVKMVLAMLVFLILDGHHLMLQASLQSYTIIGVGQGALTAALSQRLIEFTNQIFTFGIQISAPVAVTLFAVNISFGVVAKAMPQMNVLVLSFAVTALIGLVVMFLGMQEFQAAAGNILSRIGDWMQASLQAMKN